MSNKASQDAPKGFSKRLTQLAIDTGLDNNTGLFTTDSEFRHLSVAPSTLFGALRALLLQIAHPTVAQGVYEHSAFDTDPMGRAIRTFMGVFAISLGRQQTAIKIGELVFKAHVPIKGVIPAYKDKPERQYSAMEPEANLWVWATLVEGILYGHKAVNYEVSRERLEIMYQESKTFGQFFNVRAKTIPETLDDFESYFENVVNTQLDITPAGKAVGDALLGGAKFPFTTLAWLIRSLAVETLPEQIVEDFGWQNTGFTKSVYGTLQSIGRFQNYISPKFLKPFFIVWYPPLRRAFLGPGENIASITGQLENNS